MLLYNSGDIMKSRMDKYYKNEEVLQRTAKNDTLYDELYREKQVPRSNVSVIDNVNEIDISKIKTMVDSRENYKRVRNYNNIVNPIDSYRDTSIEYSFDEIDYSNYDINEIIKNKRSDKNYGEEPSKVRRITNKEYEILSSLEHDEREDEVEMSEDLINHEKQLKDLFDTVSRTAINENTDLFSNLKDDAEEESEETFYTNTSKFETEDFLDDVNEKNSSIVFVIIGVVAVLAAVLIVLYIKFWM